MACCETLSGIAFDCLRGRAGIKRAFIACYDNVTATFSNDMVATITGAFSEYQFRKQTGSVTTTITVDDINGSIFYDSAIVLQFSKQETSKRIEIAAIALGDLVVVVEDNNGKYWYFGKDFPVNLSDGTAETGTAFTDFNGYNITLSDQSMELPYELSAAAIASITGSGGN